MRFLVDAQLPRRLARRLGEAGHDAVHTLDLPAGNRTTDAALCEIADHDGRVVITKDADFVATFVLRRRPAKLLLISTGNISNASLEALVLISNLPAIVTTLVANDFVELTRDAVITHG